MPLIQLFIATYNRPTLVLKSIKSALRQDFHSYEVIISDNSSNDETEIIISNIKDPRLTYIRRKPSLTALDHFNSILKNVTSNYFMIFHDDDIMYPNMLSELYFGISHHCGTIAIGTNAYLNVKGKTTKKLFFTSSSEFVILKCIDDVVYRYFKEGHSPFPSFLYKKEVANKLQFNPMYGGKYCDVSFIMQVVTLGDIMFLNKPYFEYYFHKDQDSAKNAFIDKIKLVNFITKNSSYTRQHPLILNYRVLNLYSEFVEKLINNDISVGSYRYNRCIRLIFAYAPFMQFVKTILISFFILSFKGKNYEILIKKLSFIRYV